MKEINKLSNVSIDYRENLYKIMYSIKMNMKVYVKFLLNLLMKVKMNLFYRHEYNYKIRLFY